MKIVLFDIDGTLVKSGACFGDGKPLRSLFIHSMKEVFGVDTRLEEDISGWTDRGIFLHLAQKAGISIEDAERHMNELVDAAVGYVNAGIATARIELLDGVVELLDALKAKGYHLGLLTGNIPEIARAKLSKTGIYRYFEFGGFGTISDIRHKLIDHAIREAESKFGNEIDRGEVFYFGDAVRDVEAGKAAGVVTIAVATGIQHISRLQGAHPDYLLRDLSNTAEVVGIIDGKGQNVR